MTLLFFRDFYISLYDEIIIIKGEFKNEKFY